MSSRPTTPSSSMFHEALGQNPVDIYELENTQRWQSITEESIYLQDGILRSVGLIDTEFDIRSLAYSEPIAGLEDPDSVAHTHTIQLDCEPEDILKIIGINDKQKLCTRIWKLCARNLEHVLKLQRYRWGLLEGLWFWKFSKARPDNNRLFGHDSLVQAALRAATSAGNIPNRILRSSGSQGGEEFEKETDSRREEGRSQGAQAQPPIELSSKLGLLLIVPLLKSQAAQDDTIARTTCTLLFDMLSSFPAASLLKDVPEPLDTLEDLLSEWIVSKGPTFQPLGSNVLVALACARGSLSSILKTYEVLMKYVNADLNLQVAKLLKRLERLDVRRGEPCSIQKFRRVFAWPFDDQLNPFECGSTTSNPDREVETTSSHPETNGTLGISSGRRSSNTTSIDLSRRSLTTNGRFLFITGSKGKGLTKLGTGLEGTLQDWVYCTNKSSDGGFLAYGNGFLISRSPNLDTSFSPKDVDRTFAQVICADTLSEKGVLLIPSKDDIGNHYITLGLTSDGYFFYLLRASLPEQSIPTGNDSEILELPIWIDAFQVVETEKNSGCYIFLPIYRTLVPGGLSKSLRQDHGPRTSYQWVIHPYEDCLTALGVTLKQLMLAYMFSNGTELTLITKIEGENIGSVTTSTGTGTTGLSNVLRGIVQGPASTLHSRKSFETSGVQITIDLTGSSYSYKTQELKDFTFLSHVEHSTYNVPGSTYDFKHNLILVAQSDYMYAWRNPGYRPKWFHEKEFAISHSDLVIGKELTAKQVSTYLLKHIGMMASHFISTRTFSEKLRPALDVNIGFTPAKIPTTLELMKSNLKNLSETDLVSLSFVLRAMVSNISDKPNASDLKEVLPNLFVDMWSLDIFSFDSSMGLHVELAKLFADSLEHLYMQQEKLAALDTLFKFNNQFRDQTPEYMMQRLTREVTLKHMTVKLKDYGLVYPDGVEFLMDFSHFKWCVEEAAEITSEALEQLITTPAQELPVIGAITLYLQAATNYLLRSWSVIRKMGESISDEFFQVFRKYLKVIITTATLIIQKVIQVFNVQSYFHETYIFIENTLKTSFIGLVVPKILTFYSSKDLMRELEIAEFAGNELASLFIVLSHLSNLMNPPSQDTIESSDEDWTSQKKYLTPWYQSRYIESQHPVKENTKIRQTITIPNARTLVVKFDKECATQYEYDRLVLFSGPAGNGHIINEFGGNRFGYGGRSGHISGNWPSNLIVVNGDTLSYTFENRSAREHSTPDHACWGFGFTVYAKFDLDVPPYGLKKGKEDVEDTKNMQGFCAEFGLVNSLTLGSLEVLLKWTSQLVEGGALTKKEAISARLLSDSIFSKFSYTTESTNYAVTSILEEVDISLLTLLSNKQIQYLRESSGNIAKPQMSSRMQRIIHPDKLEPIFLTGVLRCITDIPVEEFNHENSDATVLLVQSGDLLARLFNNYNTLLRNMMSLLEMQWRVENEIEDVIQKLKESTEFFFNDPAFKESMSNVEILSAVCGVDFDGTEENKNAAFESIQTTVFALALSGTQPKLQHAEEAVKEVHRKCLFLVSTEKHGVRPKVEDNIIVQWSSGVIFLRKRLAFASYFLASPVCSTFMKDLTLDAYLTARRSIDEHAQLRILALEHWVNILQLSVPNSSTLDAAVITLRYFSSQEEILHCGNVDTRLHQLYGKVISLVVEIAARQPLLYRFPVAVLCTLPFTRLDESVIVESGLLSLVDRLCAFQVTMSQSTSDLSPDIEKSSLYNRTSTLGWAAFQMLASTCSTWKPDVIYGWSDEHHVALPIQISANVANHLARASKLASLKKLSSPLHVLSESVQDVLVLLDSLRETRLGLEILKQSPCACRLLSLLQEPSLLSPRLVLIIIRLLRAALPLVDELDLKDLPQGSVPGLRKRLVPGNSSSQSSSTTAHYTVASLLLGKLSDLLISGNQQSNSGSGLPSAKFDGETAANLNVWIIRRDNIRIRLLFEADHLNMRPTRLSLSEMESNLENDGKVLVYENESLETANPKAEKLAQMGFTLSLEKLDTTGALSGHQNSLESNVSNELSCKQKNVQITNTEACKVFLSGDIAESLSKEIIGLLRYLLRASDTPSLPAADSSSSLGEIGPNEYDVLRPETPSLWPTAVEDCLVSALKPLKKLCALQYPIFHEGYGYNSKLAVAALAVLGSFPETIREGSTVFIDQCGEASKDDHTDLDSWTKTPVMAEIISINDNTNTAMIKLLQTEGQFACKYSPSRTLQVPVTRLTPKSEESWIQLPDLSMAAQKQIAGCLRSLFLTQPVAKEPECPLKKRLPSLNQIFLSSNNPAPSNSTVGIISACGIETKKVYCATALVRLIAEIKVRASHVLYLWLKKRHFLMLFLGADAEAEVGNELRLPEEVQIALRNLTSLAKESKPSHRLESIEKQVCELRILQRDASKPQRPFPQLASSTSTHWDVKRQYPPIRKCVFSNGYTRVKYCGDPNQSVDHHGILLIGTSKITLQYYFEIQVQNVGNLSNESPFFCVGFTRNPPTSGSGSIWQMPPGSVFLQSTGRVIYYVGTTVSSWRNERIEGAIKVGDTIGIGWENNTNQQSESLEERPRQTGTPRTIMALRRTRPASFVNVGTRGTFSAVTKGKFIVTINGVLQKTFMNLDNDSTNYWPTLQLQGTNTDVSTNFGSKPFMYSGGQRLFNGVSTSSSSPPSHPHVFSESDDELLVHFTESLGETNEHFGQMVTSYPFPYIENSDSESEMSFQEIDHESEEVSGHSSNNSFRDSDEPEFLNLFDGARDEAQEDDDETPELESPESGSDLQPLAIQNRFQILPTEVNLASRSQQGLLEERDNAQTTTDNPSSEYSFSTGSEYHLAPSSMYQIRVFSGPNRNVCQCSLNSNDCEWGEGTSILSNEEEDLNHLLVKAWETKVFPIIRRRFRNESERREGLEQIRGALIIGMADIARQTVEFLYEEGSGMPHDLHFPTIEEVQEEYNKFTMKKIRIGMTVSIKPLIPSDDTESVLPKFATPQMLQCFGLTGDALDIDNENELVLVEVYVATDGVLTRFWYPLKYLEKAKQKQTSSKPVNMFKLHSNIVLLETSLSQMYCRDALLTIINVCGELRPEDKTEQAGSEPVVTQYLVNEDNPAPWVSIKPWLHLQLQNLQFKSLSSFREMPLNGDLLTWNLDYSTPSIDDLNDLRNPVNVFYKEMESKLFLRRLMSMVQVAANSGYDTLIKQVDSIFKLGTNGLLEREVQLDKEGSVDVSLPDVAFSILSFRKLNLKSSSFNQQNRKPCVHILGYNGSDLKKYSLACFPIRPLSTFCGGSTDAGPLSLRNRDLRNFLPTIMAPCDKLSCKITGTSLKDYVLKVQGIPEYFPLFISYCQTFLLFAHQSPGTISDQCIIHLVSNLCNLLQQTNLLPVVKEWIFKVISGGLNQVQNEVILKDFYLNQSLFIKNLFTELAILYKKETKSSTVNILKTVEIQQRGAGNTSTAIQGQSRAIPLAKRLLNSAVSKPPSYTTFSSNLRAIPIGSSAVSESDRTTHQGPLSSYLQTLMELCVSLAQFELLSCPSSLVQSSRTTPVLTPEKKKSPANLTVRMETFVRSNPSRRSRGKPPSGQQVPTTGTRNTPPNRGNGGRNRTLENLARKQMSLSSPVNGTSDSLSVRKSKSIAPEVIANMIKEDPAFLQNETFSWFHNILISYVILKTFTWNQLKSDFRELVDHIVPDVIMPMYENTNHSRLFIICGVPDNIHGMSIESSVNRGLNTTGGIYMNEIWISPNTNDAIIEIRSSTKSTETFEILKKNLTWYPIEDYILYPSVSVYPVNGNLEIGEKRPDQALSRYLREKIFDSKDQLSMKGEECLSYIFTSCYDARENQKLEDERPEEDTTILLNAADLLNKANGNLLLKFVENARPKACRIEDYVPEILKKFGQQRKPKLSNDFEKERSQCSFDAEPNTTHRKFQPEDEEGVEVDDRKNLKRPPTASLCLSNDGFFRWCTVLGKDNIFALWKGLFNSGYDVRLNRTWSSDPSYLTDLMLNGEWTQEQDAALVAYIDNLTQALRLPPHQIHPHEVYFEEAQFLNPTYQPLKDVPIEFIRARCCILQFLNTNVLANVLPYFPLDTGRFNRSSVANLLHDSRHLFFFHMKDEFLSQVLQHSALRHDLSPPDVILDPVQSIGKAIEKSQNTNFCKAFTQLSDIPSSLYAVPPSSGADPPLPIIVKYMGEEILGTIGSFRHFISTVVDELKSPALNIVTPCPSSDGGRNKDSFILRPGPLSFGEEKMLQDFGKFIGICLRADVPVLLQLLSATWRSLLNSSKEVNDETDDLVESDVLTASLLRSFQMIESPQLFATLLTENDSPTFQWPSMSRESSIVPLCPGGSYVPVSWETRDQFIYLLRKFRSKELAASNRVQMILNGLSTVVPLPIFFTLFTSPHLELRISGSPNVNLALLKSHTHYQVGISETDQHILYFWAVLESMTQEELRNFIKFATNQERLPASCPCQNNKDGQTRSPNLVHVPPFPMKIAPISLPSNATTAYIDKQTIRAETCLFLVRLPPYSSYQVTREQILFACNAKDDPLSG